jgi:anaerobic selenocysteine-containing dehydrogenase
VSVLMLMGANPVVSNPAADVVRQGLARSDLFTVAIDLYPTETVAYADIVLPSAMQHEQLDVVESFSHLYLNWNEPAVAPPGEALPHTEIFRRLARALAARDARFDDPELTVTDEQLVEDLLRGTVYEASGIGPSELRRLGFVRVPGTEPYRPFDRGFPTPSGRFEFASPRAAADGHGLLPLGLGADEVSSDGSALALVARASEWHVNSTFAGTSLTSNRTAEPPIDVSPEDAARADLADGDRVWVGNDRGRFAAVVRVGGEARPGVVVTTKGWWHRPLNATVREADSDMGRGAVYHDNGVWLTPFAPVDEF